MNRLESFFKTNNDPFGDEEGYQSPVFSGVEITSTNDVVVAIGHAMVTRCVSEAAAE